ncbi:Ca-activated chloride channel family protein [Shimia isoporae]|uniref:Ca-activated chloride channel family protein n=1 Tax=Shimia isoporae TaxID=647720 RepID=A0A4R1NUU8_9RHOB|nr:VWA domain-containing protein [Shimia isoporae]TCL08822.1 Ca-activated chloride channel family protein [Shimia isoporae]
MRASDIWSAFAFVSSLLASQSQAQDTKTSLVLDASGSMWGQVDGVAKITIAQDVVGDLLKQLPETQALGLTVYGHRRKGDCSDIEGVVAPARGQHSEILAAVNAVSPKGKTPLSAAVMQAANSLKHTEDKATVILISDGEETCGYDPCEVGKQLEATGVDFTLHAIGFAIANETTRRQLQCLAENTGGSYRSANDASGLAQALSEVALVAPEPEVDKVTATLSAPEKVVAGTEFNVQWQGPAEQGDWIGIVLDGTRDGNFLSRADIIGGNPLTVPAPPNDGAHELVYVRHGTGEVLATRPITVAPMSAGIEGPTSAIAGGSVAIRWSGRGDAGDIVTIAKVGASLPETMFYFHTEGAAEQNLRMPSHPGEYEVRYIAYTDPPEIVDRFPVEIVDPPLELVAPDKVQAGADVPILWSGIKSSNHRDYIAIAIADDELPHIQSYAHTDTGNFVKLQAPDVPGQYEIRYFFAEGDRIVRALPLIVE